MHFEADAGVQDIVGALAGVYPGSATVLLIISFAMHTTFPEAWSSAGRGSKSLANHFTLLGDGQPGSQPLNTGMGGMYALCAPTAFFMHILKCAPLPGQSEFALRACMHCVPQQRSLCTLESTAAPGYAAGGTGHARTGVCARCVRRAAAGSVGRGGGSRAAPQPAAAHAHAGVCACRRIQGALSSQSAYHTNIGHSVGGSKQFILGFSTYHHPKE